MRSKSWRVGRQEVQEARRQGGSWWINRDRCDYGRGDKLLENQEEVEKVNVIAKFCIWIQSIDNNRVPNDIALDLHLSSGVVSLLLTYLC